MPLSKIAQQLLLLQADSEDEPSSSDEETAEVPKLRAKQTVVSFREETAEVPERIEKQTDALVQEKRVKLGDEFQQKEQLDDSYLAFKKSIPLSDDVVKSSNIAQEDWQKHHDVPITLRGATNLITSSRKRHRMLQKVDPHVQDHFYLQCVKEGKLDKVKELFKRGQIYNKNAQDSSERYALTIAVTNKDLPMTCLLLKNKVESADCLFHAINCNFYHGMVYLLPEEFSDRQTHIRKVSGFKAGYTPILLACIKNNYRILRYLYEQNTDSSAENLTKEEGSLPYISLNEYLNADTDGKLESSNREELGLTAAANPAHISLLIERNVVDEDVFEYCLKLIQNIRTVGEYDPNFSQSYSVILIDQIEEYMCSLLNEISSTRELSLVFEYDLNDDATKSPLNLLDMCREENLQNFVSHQKSQLAVNYLRYKSMNYWLKKRTECTALYLFGLGLLFPFLSILYILFPRHTAGKLMLRPLIQFACHKVSELVFTILLYLYTAGKTGREDCLGCPPTALELVIVLWIFGKWRQEIQELMKRGVGNYFRDLWNYPDLALLALFSSCIILRIVDFQINDPSTHTTRIYWPNNAPRLWAEDLLSWAYIMVFIRLLEILKESRNLGPLLLSMVRMMIDVLKFLGIFSFIVLAFAFGLTDLYWYYGTDEGAKSFCVNATSIKQTVASCVPTKRTSFNTMENSVKTLFWSLVGQFELNTLILPSYHSTTETMGRLLIAIYHIVAIIVVLNMLIAMMSKSYELTSENEEREWLFLRTNLWIRHIRGDCVRPPPMNLIPNPYWLFSVLKEKICCCFSKVLGKGESLPLSNDFSGESPVSNTETEISSQRREVLMDLVKRYKFKHLLNDF